MNSDLYRTFRNVQDAEALLRIWLGLFCIKPSPKAIRSAAFELLDYVGGPGRGLADAPAGGTFDLRGAIERGS